MPLHDLPDDYPHDGDYGHGTSWIVGFVALGTALVIAALTIWSFVS